MSYQKLPIHFAPRTGSQTAPNATVRTMTAASRAIESTSTVLFEIGQRDERDHQGGDDVAQGDRNEHYDDVQYHDDDADKALGRLERGGPARIHHLLEISQHWDGSL